MNSADPQGNGCGALIVGHMAKIPSTGLLAQRPLPPAQFLNPVAMSFTPMSNTVGPVTMGGKIFLSNFAGKKERPISSNEHNMEVPDNYKLVYVHSEPEI